MTSVPGLSVMGLRFMYRRNSQFIDGARHDARFVVQHLTSATALATTLFKLLLTRARPEWQSSVDLLTTHSFPSGHAAAAVVLYGGLGLLCAWLSGSRRVAVAAAPLVVASRTREWHLGLRRGVQTLFSCQVAAPVARDDRTRSSAGVVAALLFRPTRELPRS